jgi:hypothetical protein
MAQYLDSSFLVRSPHFNFEKRYPPGTVIPDSGIYRCRGCAREVALAKGSALPTQAQHDHGFELGPASWVLIVLAFSAE